ncbi:hypothetical protein RFI_24951, partial [Reticulomyxa filosa]
MKQNVVGDSLLLNGEKHEKKLREENVERGEQKLHSAGGTKIESPVKTSLPSTKLYLKYIPPNLRERVSQVVEAEVLRRVNEQTDKQFCGSCFFFCFLKWPNIDKSMRTVRSYVQEIDEQLREAQKTIQELQKSHDEDFATISHQKSSLQVIRAKCNQYK